MRHLARRWMRRRLWRIRRAWGTLVVLGLLGASPQLLSRATPHPPATATPGGGVAAVERVVDGDTIVAGGETVRLIGIDTPETVHPSKPVECLGKEASAHTATLLPPGTPVRLVADVEATDRYGRRLAYVYRQRDGLFVNLELARSGYARPLTIAPNVAHASEFAAAATEARGAGRGLWGAC